jgi:hypothetical protein
MVEEELRFSHLLEAAADARRRRTALGLSLVLRGANPARRLTLEERGDVEAADTACRVADAAVARWRVRPIS